jgi:hypothetical protein
MRLVFEIFLLLATDVLEIKFFSFYYMGTIYLLFFQLGLVNIVRSLNKINSRNIFSNTTDVLQLDRLA